MTDLSKDIPALEEIIQRAQTQSRIEEGKPFLVVRSDHKVEDLERFEEYPCRKTGCPKFTRSDSFCAYVNEQKKESSRLYIPSPTEFVAVLDHHQPVLAGWGQHRAKLDLRFTPEWSLWSSKDKAKFGQREFAQFIDDNQDDVVDPNGADLLDLVRTIKATQGAEFNGIVDEKPGTFSCAYSQMTRTSAGSGVKGELELPDEFTLSISPYEGGEKLSVHVRLRFEICNGKLQLWFELVKVQKILTQALAQIAAGIEKSTGLTGWYGTPTL